MRGRLRISKKKPLENFLRKYGVGGSENYTSDHIYKVLGAIKTIIEVCGYVELKDVGKFLLRLSYANNDVLERVLDELEEYGC